MGHGLLVSGIRATLAHPDCGGCFSRFSPVIDSRFTYRGENVVQVMEEYADELVIRKPSVSISAPSLLAISIYGRISTTSCSTSHGRASRPTMRSSNFSTVSLEPNV
jgi:hypothetical protein